jgi:hypothetical protein
MIGATTNRKMARKRSIEESALMRMRLLSHWLNFWIEDLEDPEIMLSESADFGVMQIVDLQACLERLKVKLEKSRN